EWHREGRAAGLSAITYENRDEGHSRIEAGQYPQLQVFKPDEKSGPPGGIAVMVRARPTVGNCSMSAPAERGGSLPRHYLMQPEGARFLMGQYLSNNLFIYPEHQDHDPGANGAGGWGDLYPANTPCVIISQGSSLSDQPFVHAVLETIAAFPPETQKLLIEKRLLMPTVQAIFRQSNKGVDTPQGYLTGAAHPPVFDAARLDVEKMARAANQMTPELVPPVVQLEVVEENEERPGVHHFEDAKAAPLKLADTPVAVARVLHAGMGEKVMLVSAAKSGDLTGRPLQIRWQVLQGDPALVRVETTDLNGTARVRVRWQPPVVNTAGVRSHRVDIGVFALNGVTISAPAMLSFYMPPCEARFEDKDGRALEVLHQAHNPDFGLPAADTDPRWMRAIFALSVAGDGLRSRLTEKLLGESERKALQQIWMSLDTRQREVRKLEADPARRTRAAEAGARLGQEIALALREKLPGERALTARQAVERVLDAIAGFSDLYPSFQKELHRLAAQSPKPGAEGVIRAEVARLVGLGVLYQEASGSVLTQSAPEKLSPGEQYCLRGLNLTLLSHALFPEVLERSPAPAWTDPRISFPKPWRDVHRHDEEGRFLGWLRHHDGRTTWFSLDGKLLPDGPGPSAPAHSVIYEAAPDGRMIWRRAER
ncbi:MAG TPA: hypothetical protein PLP58_21050, partial [Prosthecobacter sp.]|nr:hypothetical protein [Prosthecobacter sp.]